MGFGIFIVRREMICGIAFNIVQQCYGNQPVNSNKSPIIATTHMQFDAHTKKKNIFLRMQH